MVVAQINLSRFRFRRVARGERLRRASETKRAVLEWLSEILGGPLSARCFAPHNVSPGREGLDQGIKLARQVGRRRWEVEVRRDNPQAYRPRLPVQEYRAAQHVEEAV